MSFGQKPLDQMNFNTLWIFVNYKFEFLSQTFLPSAFVVWSACLIYWLWIVSNCQPFSLRYFFQLTHQPCFANMMASCLLVKKHLTKQNPTICNLLIGSKIKLELLCTVSFVFFGSMPELLTICCQQMSSFLIHAFFNYIIKHALGSMSFWQAPLNHH
jgi:hypothetical protein